MRRLLTVLLVSSILLGCGNFRNLSHDIEAIDSITDQYQLILNQPTSDSAVVIEQIKDINKSEVDGYDGIINLSRQLSRPAQLNADQIRGYNENHLSILDNDDLFEDLSEFWLTAEQ